MDGKDGAGPTSLSWVSETERLRWAVRVRWGVIGGFLALALAFVPLGLFPDPSVIVWAALAGVVANTLNAYSVRRGRWVLAVTSGAVTIDIVLITWVSGSSGGLHSPLVVMFCVQVVATAMLVNAFTATLSAGMAALGVAVLVLLEARGATGPALLFAPPLEPVSQEAARLSAAAWGAMLAYGLVLLVFVGGFISERLRRSEASLAEQNRELQGVCDRLQQAEAQMLHTEKMRALGQLVAGVAHELNNPLSFVSANIEYLRRGIAQLAEALRADGRYPGPLLAVMDELPTVLDDCQDGARRAKQIVADLRTFARADSGDQGPFDINESVRRSLRVLQPRFKDGIALETEFSDLPPVHGCAGQVEQVVINLVVNAIEAVDGGAAGRVRVETSVSGAEVRVRVSDNGGGIAPENLSRVFEPFFTTKAVGQGTGVGLSLSYAIVQRHGGTLSVTSEPGSGTTFQIALPTATT